MNVPAIFRRRRLLISGGAAAFTPASLFASGEEGAWFEPRPTTCFADTAGTTPAGVGDTVARINDLSGNGNHAAQTTPDSRPVLQQTAGGLWYLDFDGVDDFMTLGTQSFLNGGDLFLSAGLRKLDDTSIEIFFEHGPSFDVAGQVTGRWPRTGTQPYSIIAIRNSSNSVFVAEGVNTDAAPTSGVVSLVLDDSAGSILVRHNGVSGASVATGAMAITTQETRIGAGAHHLFSMVLTNDELTTQEISDTESYVANLSGVSI